jgi:GNAT superfamily N-acetyltransferase
MNEIGRGTGRQDGWSFRIELSMHTTYRLGRPGDSYTVFRIFERTVSALAFQMGFVTAEQRDPESIQALWDLRRSMFQHLARTSAHFWLALQGDEVIGYARSILRDGLLDLTEFFVLPDQQSVGVGRELLQRVFTSVEADHRAIIATTDVRALARYLKAGVYARFPIYNFSRPPRELPPSGELEAHPLTGSPEDLQALNALDRAILGHSREPDHAYWMAEKGGFLFSRDGRIIGYGYVHLDGGPFVLAQPEDFPAVLAYAERAAGQVTDRFHLEVPLVNRDAVGWLLANGYQMSPFLSLFMSDSPWGRFENVIFPSPPFSV